MCICYIFWASQVAPWEKNPPAMQETQEMLSSVPGLGRFPWRRAWQSTPVFLPGDSHGQRSLATVHRVESSWTWLKQLIHTHTISFIYKCAVLLVHLAHIP